MSDDKKPVAVALVGKNKQIIYEDEPHGLEVGDKISVQGSDIIPATREQAFQIGAAKWTPDHFTGSRIAIIKQIIGEGMLGLVVYETQEKEYFTRAQYCIKRPPRKKREAKPKTEATTKPKAPK